MFGLVRILKSALYLALETPRRQQHLYSNPFGRSQLISEDGNRDHNLIYQNVFCVQIFLITKQRARLISRLAYLDVSASLKRSDQNENC